MNLPSEHIAELLHNRFPFTTLDDLALRRAASLFRKIRLPVGTVLYRQGDIPDHFYVLVSGTILSTIHHKKDTEKSWMLHPGDLFGAEVVQMNLYRQMDAVCETDVELLRIDQSSLIDLCKEIPHLGAALQLVLQTQILQLNLDLSWLGKNEKVSLISRRHPFFLILRILLFGAAGFTAFGLLLSLAFASAEFSVGIFVLSLVVLLVAGGLTAWAALEWTNDYFIITRERVLVQKKLIGFFESRQESPFSAILSTGLDTSLIGRVIGYGAINLRSYTGNLRFKNLPHVELIYDLLESQRSVIEKESRHQDRNEMRDVLQQRLGQGSEHPHPIPDGSLAPIQSSMYQSGSLLDLLARFFGLRHEKEGTVVYRTHWWILLRKTILPAFLLTGVVVIIVLKFMGFIPLLSDGLVYGFALIATVAAWGWWLYQYTDWHNDVYIITADQLVDINRRPLGSEERRSAPMKNIQTVEFLRKGIIGIVLNFGTVRIQIGNEELTFDNVYDPASIQAEIFAHFKQLTEKLKRIEQQKLADWISAYDQIKGQENNRSNPDERDKNG